MNWPTLQRIFSQPNLPWIVLWCGLCVLIIGLIALLRTHWGQSHPLRKCAVLSLLVHLLLAAYATTIEIVSSVSVGPPGSGQGQGVHVSIVGNDGGSALVEGHGDGSATRPWDRLPTASIDVPLPESPTRPEVSVPVPPEHFSSELLKLAAFGGPPKLPIEPAPPAASLLMGDPALKKPLGDPAEPIETVAPKTSDTVPSPQPAVTQVERTPTDVMTRPGDVAAKGVMEPIEVRPLVPLTDALPLPSANVDGGNPAPPPAAHGVPAGDPFAHGGAAVNVKRSTWANSNPATSAGNGGGEAAIPAPYAQRVAPDHGGAVRRGGGSPETEAAVQAALEWLANNQSPDGRWAAKRFGAGVEHKILGQDRGGAGAKADTGVTGLALLALLGAGHTHLAGDHAPTVRKGLEFLLNAQARDGNLGGEAETFAFMYCHGMATLALSEAYAMTHDARLEPFLKKAIGYTLSAQNAKTGGWRYKPSDEGDTSQLGWQLLSLKSAELAGIPMPQRSRDGVVRFLKSVTFGRSGGLASYRPGEKASRTMTAEALVCRQFLGMERSNPASDEAGDFIIEELPSQGKSNLYYWYYASICTYQLQGQHWEKWNAALQRSLLETQETAGALRGSWNAENDLWGGYGGRVYSTAMAALCLEVYYRYLPLYGEPDKR